VPQGRLPEAETSIPDAALVSEPVPFAYLRSTAAQQHEAEQTEAEERGSAGFGNTRCRGVEPNARVDLVEEAS
jgi:hypothetical protein